MLGVKKIDLDLPRLILQDREHLQFHPGRRLIGQKAGIPLRHLAVAEPNFLRWILNKNFSDEVKQIVREALQGRFPVRDAVPKDDPRRIGD